MVAVDVVECIRQRKSRNEIKRNKILKNKINKIKLLGNGNIEDKINLEVNYISNSAKEKITKKGGTVKLTTK